MKINSLVSVTVSALNQNINQDLNLGPFHMLKTDSIGHSSNMIDLVIACGRIQGTDPAASGYVDFGGVAMGHPSAVMRTIGKNYGQYPGSVLWTVPKADLSAGIEAMRLVGNTDTPHLDMAAGCGMYAAKFGGVGGSMRLDDDLSANTVHKITNLAAPTTDGDTLPFQAWIGTFSTTDTTTTGNPNVTSKLFRYYQIGKTVFFKYYRDSANSNGITGLTISLPIAPAANGMIYQTLTALETATASSADPLAYLDLTDNLIHFANFIPGTIGQSWIMIVTGFYEVA
jgi:hypothetical protein